MSRPKLEVADIFRDQGAAWRAANAGHASLDQLADAHSGAHFLSTLTLLGSADAQAQLAPPRAKRHSRTLIVLGGSSDREQCCRGISRGIFQRSESFRCWSRWWWLQ